MYRYRPPKSSVWGHRLRRMPVSRVRALLSAFFEAGVDEYRFHSSNIWTSNASPDIVAHYEQATGKSAEHGRIANLTYEQSESCLAVLLADEEEFRTNDIHLSLWQDFVITKWRHRDSESLTNSILGVQYDIWPHLSTNLQFESVDQFNYVRGVLGDIGLCSLNEKHLKLLRRGRRVVSSDA
jgi:hypothetical protein